MSTFDADAFMQETVDAEMDTVVLPCPPGTYSAQIEDIKVREIESNGEKRYPMDVIYNVLDDAVRNELGREKVTVRQTIWLDFDPVTGKLDASKGKNVGLGKLREACGMNASGKAFSLLQLKDQQVSIVTGLRADKNDATIKYAEVKTVGRAA